MVPQYTHKTTCSQFNLEGVNHVIRIEFLLTFQFEECQFSVEVKCVTVMAAHTDLIHFKNGKKYFWQKLHKIDSNMSHLSYNGCQKVRKIEKGQKNFEGQSKGRICKNIKFSHFFLLFRVDWSENSCAHIFLFF